MSQPRYRIFFASAARLLTDEDPHGEGLIAWSMLSGLAARGHELVVCAGEAKLSRKPPFEVVELGATARLESLQHDAYARRVSRAFIRAGGAARFDVAHWFRPSRPILFAPPGLPLVLGPLSAAWPEATRTRRRGAGDLVSSLLGPWTRARHRRVLAGAAVTLFSTSSARDQEESHNRATSKVVPFGVEAAGFSPGPPPATPTILFMGSLEPKKGVRELVEAFADVRRALPAARLVLAGDGPQRSSLLSLARELGLADSIELAGTVAHSRVPDLLREASLLCLPSHGEPFGMVVLEAMAAGRPVVATDAGGPTQLVDGARGGRIVPVRDPRALADALTGLLEDPEVMQRMGSFNRGLAETDYSLERFLDRLESAYEEATR
jgi:glycosyltransferase involved in cell wall biosynthesis